MATLFVHLTVPDDQIDVTLDDPEELANNVVGEYAEWARSNGGIEVEVVSAEWAE